MLLPDQVVPFLQHDDATVREHAARYLAEAHDPAPATADDFWRAIDRFGPGQTIRLSADLDRLPWTESSYARLMAALRDGPAEDFDYHLQRAVQSIEFRLLLAHRDELLSAETILPHVRDHLRRRIELADQPLDAVWDALLRHSEEMEDKSVGEFDSRESDRLIEAAARHGEPAAMRALGRLQGAPPDDWMEIFCVRVLGEMRYAPAAGVLVERLRVDADVLREEVVRALTRIGTVDVIDRLEAFYPGQEWHVRLYADDPLARIKRPESEQALLRLLPAETDKELTTHLAAGLCDLCTTEGLDVVGRMVAEGRYDREYVDLDELFLTVATMTGYEPQNGAALRERVERRRKERETRLASPQSLEEMLRGMRDRFRRGEPEWAAREDDDFGNGAERPGFGAAALPGWDDTGSGAPAGAPFRREAPKVGRNEPCPCGSGKKYKKCCLSAAEA